jgi:hypothetical protein
MTGESSYASEYRQGNYPQITEKQQLFRSHARRRRRKEMHRIVSENEVNTHAYNMYDDARLRICSHGEIMSEPYLSLISFLSIIR